MTVDQVIKIKKTIQKIKEYQKLESDFVIAMKWLNDVEAKKKLEVKSN